MRSTSRNRGGTLDAIAVLSLMAGLGILLAATGEAKTPPARGGPVATVGERRVEAIDIQYAALALGHEPPRGVTPRAWRRTLLDRCVDRELLALEAERRGLIDDPRVWREVNEREFNLLMSAMQEKVLTPWIVPSPAEFDSIKKTGRYRWLDLHYIILLDDTSRTQAPLAQHIADRARQGARWDSLAKIYSDHPPSAANGGHYGPIQVKDLEPESHDSVRSAKAGDVLGPYSRSFGHQLYKVGQWLDVSDDSLMRLLVDERSVQMFSNYYARVLKRYHFAIDTLNMTRAMKILRTERPDSTVASLRPDGTRPGLGIRPEIGLVARADGVGVDIADIIRMARPGPPTGQPIHVHSLADMSAFAVRTVLHGLIVRDARERGLDQEPEMARRLRLARDEVATKAMVARARPPDPDSAALQAYIEKNAFRYQRPVARVARVAMFAHADSAHGALRSWNGIGFPSDSTLRAKGFRILDRARPGSLFPSQVATLSVPEASPDPLSLSLRALSPGQFAPVTQTVQGWAVAMMTGREEAAPLSPQEAAPRALRDWREEMENRWVTDLLERLRAKTPVNVVPARLEAVRLAPKAPSAPTSTKRAAR